MSSGSSRSTPACGSPRGSSRRRAARPIRAGFRRTVRSVHHDGRADIDYDDGDAEDLVSPRYIRVFKQQAAPEKLAALIADVDDAADAAAAAAAAVASAPAARMLRLCGYLGCPLVEGHKGPCAIEHTSGRRGSARSAEPTTPAASAPSADAAPVPAPEAAAEPSAATPSPAAALPPGWSREQRTAQPSGRKYYIFHGPAGEKFDSAAKAWRKHLEANGAGGREDANARDADAGRRRSRRGAGGGAGTGGAVGAADGGVSTVAMSVAVEPLRRAATPNSVQQELLQQLNSPRNGSSPPSGGGGGGGGGGVVPQKWSSASAAPESRKLPRKPFARRGSARARGGGGGGGGGDFD